MLVCIVGEGISHFNGGIALFQFLTCQPMIVIFTQLEYIISGGLATAMKLTPSQFSKLVNHLSYLNKLIALDSDENIAIVLNVKDQLCSVELQPFYYCNNIFQNKQ